MSKRETYLLSILRLIDGATTDKQLRSLYLIVDALTMSWRQRTGGAAIELRELAELLIDTPSVGVEYRHSVLLSYPFLKDSGSELTITDKKPSGYIIRWGHLNPPRRSAWALGRLIRDMLRPSLKNDLLIVVEATSSYLKMANPKLPGLAYQWINSKSKKEQKEFSHLYWAACPPWKVPTQ